MTTAWWNGEIIAASDETVVVEGNHYFPRASVSARLVESDTHTTCPWKGTASYFSIEVAGDVNQDAVWYYPEPKEAAKDIAGHVAFWKGVVVSDD